MEAILTCEHLCKQYGATRALSDVSIGLPRGRIIGLLGPNGSGKTTLLKLLAGLLVPTSGSVRVAGLPVGRETKALVSFLPERTYLSPGMRVTECLDYFCDFYADFDRARAEQMLASLQVPLDARMRTLSKGTREKVQLVLVMARRAALYLLDEPIGGVDPATRDYILHTIISNYNPEAAVIISTHLIADVEPVLDDVIFLDHGHIALHESCEEIRETRGQSVDALFREVFKCWEN